MSAKVAGYCPMGCGQTLLLGSGGYVTCSWVECPEPDAASTLLEKRQGLKGRSDEDRQPCDRNGYTNV